jgi:hypothetical protein
LSCNEPTVKKLESTMVVFITSEGTVICFNYYLYRVSQIKRNTHKLIKYYVFAEIIIHNNVIIINNSSTNFRSSHFVYSKIQKKTS